MILTEKDAASKQCRVAPPAWLQKPSVGGNEVVPMFTVCVGSGCMSWRGGPERADGVPCGFCGAGTAPMFPAPKRIPDESPSNVSLIRPSAA